MKIKDCVQGSPEWYRWRTGIPTASEFSRIITPATGKYAAAAPAYMDELLAERLGELSNFQGTPDTERGNHYEKEALRWLAFRHKIKAEEVGFCLSDCGRYGASPDSLIDRKTPVEVKCPRIKTFLGWLREYEETGTVPREHKVQVHGEMFVTGADRCIFVAYANSEFLDNLMIEVKRDDFTEQVGTLVLQFCEQQEKFNRERLGESYCEVFNEDVAA